MVKEHRFGKYSNTGKYQVSQTSKKGENSLASRALKCTMVLFVEKTLNKHYTGSYDSLESLSEILAFCGEINEVICYTLFLNL